MKNNLVAKLSVSSDNVKAGSSNEIPDSYSEEKKNNSVNAASASSLTVYYHFVSLSKCFLTVKQI